MLGCKPSQIPHIKKLYRMDMIAGLTKLLQHWEDFIGCVKVESDKEVFYAVAYNSRIKECVNTKLTGIGVTYCVVKNYSETLKLQGTISQNEFNNFM